MTQGRDEGRGIERIESERKIVVVHRVASPRRSDDSPLSGCVGQPVTGAGRSGRHEGASVISREYEQSRTKAARQA